MIENLTIGAIASSLIFIVGLIAAWKSIRSSMKENLTELLDDKFESIDDSFESVNTKIDNLDRKLDGVEIGSCKNYIVPYIADMERGAIPDEIERQLFWDAYETYIKDGGNSYIQDRVTKLKKEGKI